MIVKPDTWEMGPDGRVLKVSEVWLETIGRHAIDAPGYCWSDYVHEDDRASVLAALAEHKAAHRPFVIAFRALHHSGRPVRLLAGGRPLADGGYVGWTRVARIDRCLIDRVAEAVCFVGIVVA